jgi:hypothetical protein
MDKKRMSKSVRKYIRLEKARIRRQVLDIKKQGELISDLYKKLSKQNADSGNIQSGNK